MPVCDIGMKRGVPAKWIRILCAHLNPCTNDCDGIR